MSHEPHGARKFSAKEEGRLPELPFGEFPILRGDCGPDLWVRVALLRHLGFRVYRHGRNFVVEGRRLTAQGFKIFAGKIFAKEEREDGVAWVDDLLTWRRRKLPKMRSEAHGG